MTSVSGPVGTFDREQFAAALGGCGLARSLQVHECTSSTMTLADELLRAEGAGTNHGTLILSEMQTAGQGRRGRSWLSSAGNLYFSMIWVPKPGATLMDMLPELTRLNLATGVAVVNAAAAAGFPGGQIKWPNDVYHGTPPRKLSGMLINFNGKDAAVLGVGINVMQDMTANATAVSLADLHAERPAELAAPVREVVLAAFCKELERLMALSNAEVLLEYGQHDLLRGMVIRVHHKTREEDDPRDFDAEALGVDPGGELRVRPLKPDAQEVLLSGEEVSITPMGRWAVTRGCITVCPRVACRVDAPA